MTHQKETLPCTIGGRSTALSLSRSQTTLGAPFFLEMDPQLDMLYPSALVDNVTVRVPAFEGMWVGQLIELYWKGRTERIVTTTVLSIGQCIDLWFPKSLVLDSSFESWGAPVTIHYEARRREGGIDRSPSIEVFMLSDSSPNPAVEVPGAPTGYFNPALITAPGLEIVFPVSDAVWPMWCSYGRDGRRIATIYPPINAQGSMHVPLDVLAQTEVQGDVWISYAGTNSTGTWVESRFTRLRVSSQNGQ